MTIRVLVIDDSATMRRLIAATLSRDPQIEVVGEAGHPLEAREAIKRLSPDVLTLDIEMPNMNGLDFLERVMRLRPMPVIMVSTLTRAGAAATLRALEIGAFDCVGKPGTGGPGFGDLVDKVKAAAKSRRSAMLAAVPSPRTNFRNSSRIVAIGASTGGVEALTAVLTRFPANCPPTVVTQHMPALFTQSFADRLDRLCAPRVVEVTDGAPLEPGHVYLAPGDYHLEVVQPRMPRCQLSTAERVNGHRPSVDVMFNSVAKVCGRNAVGTILTGMGRDGASGLLAMRKAGAATVGQDEDSCIVYGMPRIAHEIGAVEHQVTLHRIGDRILDLAGKTIQQEVV